MRFLIMAFEFFYNNKSIHTFSILKKKKKKIWDEFQSTCLCHDLSKKKKNLVCAVLTENVLERLEFLFEAIYVVG